MTVTFVDVVVCARVCARLSVPDGDSSYDLQSADAYRELRPFFFERTEQFVHELVAFARSPFEMPVYDRYVQYARPGEVGRTPSLRASRALCDAHHRAKIDAAA